MDRHELSDDRIRNPFFTVAVCLFILIFGFLFSCLGAAMELSDGAQRRQSVSEGGGSVQRQMTATEAGSESALSPATFVRAQAA